MDNYYLRRFHFGIDEGGKCRQAGNLQNEDTQTETEIVVRQKQFNEKLCSRCCANFNATNKKYLCDTCSCNVCKACSQWNGDTQSWICKFCNSRDSSPSPEWLQKKLLDRCRVFESARKLKNLLKVSEEYEKDNENDSGYHPSMSVTSEGSGFGEPAVDPAILEVHEHVEAIIEQLLGDSIDNTTLDPLCRHPEYDRMIEIYHSRLRDTLAQFIQSLQMAIKNHPLDDDQTPTSSHSTLKYIINEIVGEATELPCLLESGGSVTPQSPFGPQRSDAEDDDLDYKSYEEILATAILNKIIHQRQIEKLQTIHWSQEDFGRANDRFSKTNNTRVLSNKEIQTDLDTDAESEITRRSVNRVIHSSPTMEFSEDESTFGSESAGEDFSWANGANERSPAFDYVVEEQIEEITTTVENSSDCEEDQSQKSRKGNSHVKRNQSINRPLITRYLVGEGAHSFLKFNGTNLELGESHKVPFPEFGMDVVTGDVEENNIDQDYMTFLSVIENWEDNWLFRKKKTISPFINLGNLVIGDEPVAMLVPNPTDDVKATVGNRSIDELSDLSEQNSEGSVEFSSNNTDNEEDEEEDDDNEIEEGDEMASEEADKSTEIGTENLKPDMATWALNSMQNYNTRKMSNTKPEVIGSSLRSVGDAIQYDVVDKNIVLDAYFKTSNCQLNSSISHLPDEDPDSQQLKTPTPAPRKSKSSVCSEETHFINSSEVSVPRFVPTASRCLDHNGINFVHLPRNTLIPAGRVATVKCCVTASKPYNVAWYFGSEPLEKSETVHMYSVERDTHCLEIYDASEIHSGVYSCLAYGDTEETWADFKVTVYGSCTELTRPEIKRHLINITVEKSEPIVLHCKAVGIPEPRLLWFKDSKQIRLGNRFTLDRKSQGEWILTIQHACSQDSGHYKVVAKNKAGEASSVSNVAVVVPRERSHLLALTARTNQAQEAVYIEAEDMVNSANKENMAGAIRETTGQTLDLIVRASNEAKRRLKADSQYKSLTTESDTGDLIPDVIPGSIAERERQKWKNAVDMPNNPYTLENISKRAQRRNTELTKEARLSNGESLDSDDDHVVRVKDGPVRVDCGLKMINPSKYKRDYYVNNSNTAKKYPERPVSLPLNKKNEVELNAIEEKVYVSTAKILSLEDKIDNIESQVSNINNETSSSKVNDLEDKVAMAAAQVVQSEKQVSKVEKEVARLQREIQHHQKKYLSQECLSLDDKHGSPFEVSGNEIKKELKLSTFEINHMAENDMIVRPKSLDVSPSVRALASKFDGPNFKQGMFQNGSFEHKEDGTTIVRIDTKKPSPAPRGSRMSESKITSPSSLEQQASNSSSLSSITSINCSKTCTELKPEVFADSQNDNVDSPAIDCEENLDRSPCVKRLSQMFVEESSGEGNSPSSPVEASVRRVHSLTARSLSKEFREATQRNKPRQMNRNISLCNDQDGQSYNKSLENTAELPSNGFEPNENDVNGPEGTTNTLPVEHIQEEVRILIQASSSSHKTKPVKNLSSSIKNRAAFWDRRVEEDRMTDQSLADHFPPMESPLYQSPNGM